MEGFEGWDDYAPFYDWENARTLGRRDVPFWRNLALNAGGPVLELGSPSHDPSLRPPGDDEPGDGFGPGRPE